jgi:hypothetical protein
MYMSSIKRDNLKYILLIFLLITNVFAKKDFYYSYIDDEKNQFKQSDKSILLQTNSKIVHINKLIKDNEITKAYKQIVLLKDNNKQKVLNSSIELLYAKVLYLRIAKKFSIKAHKTLNDAINKSIINDNDLLDALKLLVKINIKINKPKIAKLYAKTILETFDDPLGQAYGKISLSLVDIKQKRYKRAIKTLYKILVKTTDIQVATLVSDELFDAYILNDEFDKAKNLTQKVLDKNMEYYSSNSYIAMIKINKLLKVNMPHLAIKILKNLLKKAQRIKHINNFKYKLANIYMSIGSKDDKYMILAKELYKDLIRQKQNVEHKKNAKMYLDEILMRQGVLTPQIVASKYPESASMYNKTLLQELLNYKKTNSFKQIEKIKHVYLKIDSITTKRFGYKNIQVVFDDINSNMVKEYLDDYKCDLLSKQLEEMPKNTFIKLIEDQNTHNKLFDCLLEFPNEKSFLLANDIYSKTKNPNIYFNLEKIALKLGLNKKAYELSQKISMTNDNNVKSSEFLYKFLIYSKQNNSYSMDKFFTFALQNENYITNNQENPMIIDFYYQMYLYLIKNNKNKQAMNILNKLYIKQKDMDAYIYSPFVEMQISQNKVLDDDYLSSISYLEDALENTRKIKNSDLVEIYFNMAKAYKKLNKENRYKDSIEKCKNVKDVDTMYKNMCDKL